MADEHGKPRTGVKRKTNEMEADRIKGHLDKKRRMTNRENYVLFNAPQIMGALRAPAIVLKKDAATPVKAVGGESRWIAVEEVVINNTQRSSYPHIFHTSDFHSSRSQKYWKSWTRFLGKFPKHEVLMELDANATLACHSDGVRVGVQSQTAAWRQETMTQRSSS